MDRMEKKSVIILNINTQFTEYEKQLITLNDKYQVFRAVIDWDYFKVIPSFNPVISLNSLALMMNLSPSKTTSRILSLSSILRMISSHLIPSFE